MTDAVMPMVWARLSRINPLPALSHNFDAEADRLVLWLPVFLGLGVAAYFALPSEPPTAAVFFFAGLAVGLCALAVWSTTLRRICLASAFLCLGLAAGIIRTLSVDAPVLPRQVGPTIVEGQVLSIEIRESRPRVLLTLLKIEELPLEATPERVRIRLSSRMPHLRPGQSLRVKAVLRPPPEPAAPGAFDFARQAYFQRLGAVGYAVGSAEAWWSEDNSVALGARWHLWWASLRRLLGQRIAAVLDGQPGAVAIALVTGDRSAISEPVLDQMRFAGLAHLLAISGLHLGLVAGLVFIALRTALASIPPVALRFPIKKWAAVGAAFAAVFYLFLVGATIPTQRAAIMVGLVLLALVLDRDPISLRVLACAASLVLLLTPESLLSASFQMSFAAVTGLIAGYEALRWHRKRYKADRSLLGRLGLYFGFLLFTSLIANLATAPYAVYHFNRLPLYGLLANLVAVPLTAFWIMPAAVLAVVLMPIGLESWPILTMGAGLEILLSLASEIASWENAVLPVRAMSIWGLAVTSLGGLWLCLWWQRWRVLGLFGPVLGVVSIVLSVPPDILVNGEATLMAIRTSDGGMAFSSLRKQQYLREVWLRRSGSEIQHSWPLAVDDQSLNVAPQLRCDGLGCIYGKRGRSAALLWDSRALEEDCLWVDVVVSLEPLFSIPCPNPILVVDRFDIWRHGGHAIWFGQEPIRFETVQGLRGQRPWVRQRIGSGSHDDPS